MTPSRSERSAVLFDPHPLWLDAVEQAIARAGVRAVGKTTSPEEAFELVEEHEPDVLVAEISTEQGPGEGINTLVRAREIQPELKMIVLSTSNDPQHIDAAFAAGAAGYVLKSAHPEDVALAIRQAFEHSIYLAEARVSAAASLARPSDAASELTRRELEILQLVAEGHTNATLAKMLWVTEQTVKFHLSNIYRKLNVSNRTEAGRWAQVHNLLPASEDQPTSTRNVALAVS
jgi:DNA-binding NarL/FixJ family response regulator